MPINPLISSINSGEFSPRMEARTDFERYPNAAKMCRNFVLLPQGGISRRPGTRFVKEAKNSADLAKLISFEFSETDSYMLEHGDGYLRFYRRQGQIEVEDTDAAILNGDFAADISDWTDASSDADFPTIATTNTSNRTSTGTNHNVALPAGIVAGDLLLIIFRTGDTSTSHATPSGWQLLGTRSSNGRTSIYYKIATGTEGATVAITSGGSRTSAHHSYRIENFAGLPEIVITSSNTLDPAAITPSWGSAKNLFIAFASMRRTDQTGPAAPTNYTDLLNEASNSSSSNSSHTRLLSARRELEAGSDDPDAFTLTGVALEPHSGVIVIKPTSAAGSIEHDVTNGRLQLNGIDGARSAARQAITIAGGNTAKEHVLRFRVDGFGNGRVGFRVGSTAGAQDILEQIDLGIGYHSIGFVPGVTTFYVEFRIDQTPVQNMWIDDVAFIDDAPLELTSPYSSGDLEQLQYFQAADVVYLLHPDFAPRRLERRGHRRWSIVTAFFRDGPYLGINDGRNLNEDALFENPLFENGMVGWDGDNSTNSAFVVHSDSGKFVEMDPGQATPGQARLEAQATTISGHKHVAHVLILAEGPVGVKFGTALGGGQYVDESVVPGWHSFEFTAAATELHVQFSYSGSADKGRAAVGGCLVYSESARLLQPSDVRGEVSVIARGFSPFTASDVGRLLRMEWPGREPGYGIIVAFNSASSVQMLVLRELPSSTPTETWRFGAWGGSQGYPKVVSFFDGRSVFANTAQKPQTLWFSRSAGPQDMRPDSFEEGENTVLDDDAITISFESTKINPVLWLSGQRQLMSGTAGGEWIVTSNGAVITPSDRGAKQHAAVPSAALKAIEINQTTLFAARAQREVHDLGFSFEQDSFLATDLTILSDHIFRSPVQEMVYQRSPYSIVWCRRADGRLATLSYNQQHQILGWAQSIIGGRFGAGDAVVESIAIIPGSDDSGQQYPSDERNELWMLVKRTINGETKRYIEFMEYFFDGPLREDYDGEVEWQNAVRAAQADAFYVDSGLTYDDVPVTTVSGLDHLEGETVKVLADGKVHPDKVVTDGAVTINEAASKIHVGLPFKHRYESLKLAPQTQSGTGVNKTKIITSVGMILLDSAEFQFTTVDFDDDGRRQHQLDTVKFLRDHMPEDEAIPLFTGERTPSSPGSYSRDSRIYIEGEAPLPFNLLGLAPQMEVRNT